MRKRKQLITEISVEVFDKKTQPIGEKKFFHLPNKQFLNVWLKRPKANNAEGCSIEKLQYLHY